jgi:hypothetical protein
MSRTWRHVLHLFPRTLLLWLLLPGVTACTSMVPRQKLPAALTGPDFGDPVKVVTIPLPAIASSPNEGVSGGILTAFLLYNRKDEVSTLLAPQVNYNRNFGVTATLYGAFYPLPTRSYEINLSQSTKINYDYEFKIRDQTHWDHKLELNSFLFAFADGSARFFGFEARSPQQQETNYADTETGFDLSAGYDVGGHFQLVIGERLRDVDIHRGAVNGILFIRDRFQATGVPGLNGFTAHAQRLSLIYSTLDSPDMPTSGVYARATVENSSKMLGSTADYWHFGGEIKGFIPLDDARYVSVIRLACNQTQGNRVPFLEQSILGGENTLRGYGNNRFIDNCYLLLNLEERIRLFRWEVFHVNADWEVAPFIDLGSIMSAFDKARAEDFEFNPGLGLRAVVRPNIVGRIDIGFGKEGPAVFVGLRYPF